MKPIRASLLAAGALALASCASVKTAGNKVAQFSVHDLMPSKIQVVEVRAKDLKEIALGKERALAYTDRHGALAQRKSDGFWGIFRGPVDFKEPTLPATGDPAMEDGLLPPRVVN